MADTIKNTTVEDMLLGVSPRLFAFYRSSRPLSMLRILSLCRQNETNIRNFASLPTNKILFGETENLRLDDDRLLFRNVKHGQVWKLHLYAIICGVVSCYCAVFFYAYLVPPKRKPRSDKWTTNYFLRMHEFLCKWKLVFCGLFVGFGLAQVVGMTWFLKRNVHSIVLLKNGREVLISTYGTVPLLKARETQKLRLTEVSCLHGRNEALSYLKLAIAGRKSNLYINANGTFYSPDLFDRTVGVMRKLKK